MIASPPIDYHAHDSYFIVQHFHYTIGGGSMFALFGALVFLVSEDLRHPARRAHRALGLSRCCSSVSMLTFIPMGFMGMEGMARRVYTYPALGHLALLNAIATAGAALMTAGVIAFFVRRAGLRAAEGAGRGQSVGRLQSGMDDVVAAARVQFRRAAADSQPPPGAGSLEAMKTFVGLFAIVGGVRLCDRDRLLVRRTRGGRGNGAARRHGCGADVCHPYAVLAERDADLEGDDPNQTAVRVAGERRRRLYDCEPVADLDRALHACAAMRNALVAASRPRRFDRNDPVFLAPGRGKRAHLNRRRASGLLTGGPDRADEQHERAESEYPRHEPFRNRTDVRQRETAGVFAGR